MRRQVLGFCAAIVLCMAGCSSRVQDADGDEMGHPMMEKAKELGQSGDIQGAVRIYAVLLEKHADMARAHLELALLLDRPGEDYVRAMYHYQRYLDLRTDTQKRKMIEERIRAATMALAEAVSTNEMPVARRAAGLSREIKELKVRNANLETQLTRMRIVVSNLHERVLTQDREKVVHQAPTPSPPAPPIRTIKVRNNDTLRRIAERVYGDQGRWRDIYEANRTLLHMPEDVRVGQILVLPE